MAALPVVFHAVEGEVPPVASFPVVQLTYLSAASAVVVEAMENGAARMNEQARGTCRMTWVLPLLRLWRLRLG